MPEKDKPKCSAVIFDHYKNVGCPNPGKVQREGKWYCGTHDPVRLKIIRDANDAKHKAKWEIRGERWKRQAAEHQACQGVPTEDLRPGLLAELLAKAKDLLTKESTT